jgi:hypothetical protein
VAPFDRRPYVAGNYSLAACKAILPSQYAQALQRRNLLTTIGNENRSLLHSVLREIQEYRAIPHARRLDVGNDLHLGGV